MPAVSETTVPTAHTSWSQLSQWIQCAKSYQLDRVLGLPETPSYSRAGGHAVHAATEAYDRMHVT
jgi:hypothetical protein